jgi:hypothetical protein
MAGSPCCSAIYSRQFRNIYRSRSPSTTTARSGLSKLSRKRPGSSLQPSRGVTAEGTRFYRASKMDCDVCKLKAQCCPNALARKIPRDLDEDARDVARAHAATPQYVEACRRRKKVEMLFAHLKRILRLTRLRLRGPNGARDEFLLAATAQNLRRLARLRPINILPEMLPA